MVEPLVISTPEGVSHHFTPQLDITTFELALLLSLFAKLLAADRARATIPDWRGYLEEHKLTRHFTPID